MLKTDCKFFPGDRPCNPHKETGIKCDDCNYYQSIKFKILIVKLDAVGDVLRTTSILPPLKKRYPESYIVWCTRNNAKELFFNSEYVNEVITVEDDALYRLSAEEFNLVINLDTSKISSSVAAMAKGEEKKGFVLNKKGYVQATSEETEQWLEMSAFDDVKKVNTKSYQQIMYEILGLTDKISRPVLNIPYEVAAAVRSSKELLKIKKDLPTIGLNIGVGTKWPNKGWPLFHWKELIRELKNSNINLLLLGGPEEKDKVKEFKDEFDFLIDTGTENSLLEFASIVDLCDIIITGDTLALHIATALNKKIVALFGPTSSNEIELYGKGIKMLPPEECKCYYNHICGQEIFCMEKITPEKVVIALRKLIGE